MIAELEGLLGKEGQVEWDTNVRVEGLMLFLNHCLIRDNKHGFCISAALAEQYVSEISRPSLRAGPPDLVCVSHRLIYGRDFEARRPFYPLTLPLTCTYTYTYGA